MGRKIVGALLVCVLLSLSACNLPTSGNQPAVVTQTQPTRPVKITNTAAALAKNTAEATAVATSTKNSAMILTVKETHEKSENPKYQLDARWPYLQWNGDPRADAFNKAAEAFATGEVQHFKDGVLSTPADPNFKDLSSAIDINFSQTNETNGILSVLFKVYFYAAGAAHPGHYSSAINYDLRQGKVIALADLFKPGTAYLDFLSTTCITDLKSRDVLAWEDGALPKEENYKIWNITPDGLLITFDEYQVTPYAMGPQTVMIPYAKIKDLARADGPLAPFLK